jgi:hypothetical protein
MANRLAGFDFHVAPQNQPTLNMAGVETDIHRMPGRSRTTVHFR